MIFLLFGHQYIDLFVLLLSEMDLISHYHCSVESVDDVKLLSIAKHMARESQQSNFVKQNDITDAS